MSKALAIDFSTSNTGYAFHNPLTNEYVVGSIAGGNSKDPLERAKLIADGITEIIEHYNLFDYFTISRFTIYNLLGSMVNRK